MDTSYGAKKVKGSGRRVLGFSNIVPKTLLISNTHCRYDHKDFSIFSLFIYLFRSFAQDFAIKISGEPPFLCATPRLDLIHIPINCMKISLTVTELWNIQDCFTDGWPDGQSHAIKRRFFKKRAHKNT